MTIEGEVPRDGGSVPSLAKGVARLVRTEEGVWVEGDFGSTAEAECSRCLVPFGLWISMRVDEMFLPTIDIQTGRRIRVSEDEDQHFAIDRNNVLDLTEAVRQYTVAAMPLQPLCQDYCSGLCPQCGTNLNENECACAPAIDPRWEPLRQFLVGETDR